MRGVGGAARARYLVVSFSDEGTLALDTVRAILGERGPVREIAVPYKRYVGAQIGIYNPQGERVGTPGRLTNHESPFVGECAAVAAS